MREAIKSAVKFSSAPVWNSYIVGSAVGLAANETDAALDAYAAANTGTLFHPVGTASMSKKGAPNGVVDPDLRLKKVDGVRVVDASVLVSLILHFQTTVNMSIAIRSFCTHCRPCVCCCGKGR